MKILTITGTRPELIRLNLIIKKLDKLVNHILVYTNQNYDYDLSTVFFDQLQIRQPNYYFNFPSNSFGEFLGWSIMEFERVLLKEKPDKILVLGDTNSGLLSIVGEKYKIPIYHMEAGNRCYDNRLPEETNRRIIDNVSTYNLPYTEGSKQILLDEKFDRNKVFKTGNPIYEVLNHYVTEIEDSDVLERLNIKESQYVLVTAHRTENVDDENTLKEIVRAINKISERYTVVFSVHPRTKNKMNKFDVKTNENVKVSRPFGFFDFVKLEKNAMCVISDSGTVQEETCIFGVPAITIRRTTERRETVECGSNILSGTNYDDIMESFDIIVKKDNKWVAPSDYLVPNVSDIIVNILAGKK